MERETRARRIGLRLARLRNFKFWETETYATVLNAHRHGDAARPRQCGHRSDGAEAISKGADARRIWANTFLRLALFARRETESGICAEFSALQGRFGLVGARQFWLRLQPRARSLGRERLWISRGHRAELC